MQERTLQGALTLLGFIVSIMAVFYFAMEYLPAVSEWTRLGALVLLGIAFAFLGVYLRQTSIGGPFFNVSWLLWLSPPVVLYLLAIVSGVAAEGVFLGINDLDQPVKILVSLVVGIGLIVLVARRRGKMHAGESRDAPSPAAAAKSPKPKAAAKSLGKKPKA